MFAFENQFMIYFLRSIIKCICFIISVLLLPTASFDMKISVDGLFFIGSQLVALSYTGKVAVWQSMTQHWQVSTSLCTHVYMIASVGFLYSQQLL